MSLRLIEKEEYACVEYVTYQTIKLHQRYSTIKYAGCLFTKQEQESGFEKIRNALTDSLKNQLELSQWTRNGAKLTPDY